MGFNTYSLLTKRVIYAELADQNGWRYRKKGIGCGGNRVKVVAQ